MADITYEERIAWRFEFYGNRCAYCEPSGDRLAADHVLPLASGGGNLPANIRPACHPCNTSKGSTSLSVWKREKKNGLTAYTGSYQPVFRTRQIRRLP